MTPPAAPRLFRPAGTRRRGSLLLPVLLLAAAAWGAAPPHARAHPPAPASPVVGTLAIAFCDDPGRCDAPPPGTAPWRSLPFGPGGAEESDPPHREGVAWGTLPFDAPPGAPSSPDPALLLTRLADAEEVWLNGVLLARHGRIGERIATIPGAPRVVPVPPGVLREGRNVIALRLLFTERTADALHGGIFLGDRTTLAVTAERERSSTLVVETAFLSTFLFMLLVFGLLVSQRVPRPEYPAFFVFLALYTAGFTLGSNLLLPPEGGGAALHRIREILAALRVPVMLFLVTTATESPRGRLFTLLGAAALLLVAAVLVCPPLQALQDLTLPRKGLSALLGAYYLYLAGRAALARRPDSLPVLAGVVGYVTTTRLDLFRGLPLSEYGVAFFSVCMLYALLVRHARIRRRLLEVSTRLLDAHEAERSRIARELHDSVGQALLALRLRLKMASARAREGTEERGALASLADDTLDIVEDVRRAALDMRPSYVKTMTLPELLRWHAAFVGERTGVAVRVLAPADPPDGDLPPRVKENLYRIFQEATANAVKHSGAGRIDVSVYRDGAALRLVVSDNGRGFVEGDGGGGGAGLSTMRERAELLGGTFLLRSAPGRGTTVEVEVKVRTQ